jgi:hypothetical protein
MALKMWPGRKPQPVTEQEPVEVRGDVDMQMVAQPLVLGKEQDPVAYAKFRLDQIKRHIEFHGVTAADKFMREARAETYALLHMLHIHGAMTNEEEDAHLAVVIPKPGKS